MKNNMKKILLLTGVLCLASVGGVSAYLTDYDKVSNQFTVGKVDVELTEDNWKPDDHKKIEPGKVISKERLSDIFMELADKGANNINLVTPGQWQPWIIAALDIARAKGLHLPILCNTGGYETVESVESWRGYIDIWLADLKYVSSALSAELSSAPDYFAQAKPAIEAMMAQAGHPVFNAEGILQKGVILRHLALPGHVDDSFAVLDQMAAWNDADPGCFIPSVMSQYTPFYKAAEHGIGRRITTYEYRRVVNYAMDKGLAQGYMQQKSSAKEEYTPSFDLTGV